MDSESSQVYLFKWLGEKVQETSKIYINAVCTSKGFSYLTYSKSNLKQLVHCVENVLKYVDNDYNDLITVILTWSVSLGFTAQSNPVESIEIQEKIYNQTLDLIYKIQSKNNTYQFDVKHLETLKSSEQGLFYWLSANYELSLNRNEKKSTFGILQMDDVSTSIAYSSEDGQKQVSLFNTKYRVKTISNMCYGYMTHVQRYLIALIVHNDGASLILDPCLNSGVNRTFIATEINKWKCGEVNSKYSFIKQSGKVYTFVGQPNHSVCHEVNKKLLGTQLCGTVFRRCPLNEKMKRNANMKFMATTSFKDITSVIHLNETTNKNDFQRQTEEYCNLKWHEIVAEDRFTHKYEINHCLLLSFIYQYLSEMHSFDESNWKLIMFRDKFNIQEYGTSLGYLLNSHITETSKIVKVSNTASIIGYIILIIICLIVIYLAIKLINRALQKEHEKVIENNRHKSEKLLLTHKHHDHNQNDAVVLQFE